VDPFPHRVVHLDTGRIRTRRLPGPSRWSSTARFPRSANETTGLGPIAEGMSNRTIAARLYVTERTVEAHVTQIFQKLHLPESPDQHRRVLAVLAFLRA
jgi:ATP/maltotriose-dependent transcriptional regulator MalT